MSPEHHAKMMAGRERARLEGRLGGRPRKETPDAQPRIQVASIPVTETPEFKEAVAAAVKSAAAAIMAELAAARVEAGPAASMPETNADMSVITQLAMSMARMADQGSGRAERVPPEIMAAREKSATLMRKLILDAHARSEMPIYRLSNKTQLITSKGPAIIEPQWLGNDKIHYPTEIDYPGIPNNVMIPVNDVAKEIFAAFEGSIGTRIDKDVEIGMIDQIAMTAGGMVVRGGAAASLFRAQNREMPGTARDDMVGIRRNQPSQTKDINVLGSIHPPARQNA